MSTVAQLTSTRRAFLKFLASSPLFAAVPGLGFQSSEEFIISDASQAINILEFEAAARKALPPAHWGYLSGGVDDDATVRANREGFSHYQLRSRRLVDTTNIDMSVELFGTKWETPVLLAPSGTLFGADGVIGVARAAQKQKSLQILGGVQERNHPIEEVMKARGGPVWYQLYASQDWPTTLETVNRIERSGCPVLVDGGFRRGTDVFKALALGARAVGIGRPYMWGLAAFGQSGVESVLTVMRREFNLIMAECGKRSIAEITPSSIVAARYPAPTASR